MGTSVIADVICVCPRFSLTSRRHRARVHLGVPPPLPLHGAGVRRRGDDVIAAASAANASCADEGGDAADGRRAVAVVGPLDGGLDERGVPGRRQRAVGSDSASV